MDDNACHDKLGDVVPAITLPNCLQIRLAVKHLDSQPVEIKVFTGCHNWFMRGREQRGG
jgi:hypothetical protein